MRLLLVATPRDGNAELQRTLQESGAAEGYPGNSSSAAADVARRRRPFVCFLAFVPEGTRGVALAFQ
jgi:hypothetical protein